MTIVQIIEAQDWWVVQRTGKAVPLSEPVVAWALTTDPRSAESRVRPLVAGEIGLKFGDMSDGCYLQHQDPGPRWVTGTVNCAAEMDRLGMSSDVSLGEAMAALSADGLGRRREVVQSAIAYRTWRAPRDSDA